MNGGTMTVSKWGNSLALRIPTKIAKQLGIGENSQVDLSVVGNKLVVKRSASLADLCSQITQENNPVLIDLGEPVGKEEVEYEN